MAWKYIFQGSGDAAILTSLWSLFPENANLIEDRGFSHLHRAILGLEHGDLEQYVKTYSSTIDHGDIMSNVSNLSNPYGLPI